MTRYNVGNGIFMPYGWGGGIFDGDLSGTAPRLRSVRGLGAVPANCWNVQGFKECHDEQFKAAQKFCGAQTDQWLKDRGYASRADCEQQTDSAYTDLNCVSKLCPAGGTATPSGSAATGSKYPWGVYSADTVALQKSTNDGLKAAGYCTLTADGKLGPATCGARLMLRSTSIPGMQYPDTCQKFTAPRMPPCGGTAPAIAITPPPPGSAAAAAATMPSFGTGTDWKKYAAFAAGALIIGGAAWFLMRKKKA